MSRPETERLKPPLSTRLRTALTRATSPLRSSFAKRAGILSGGQFVSAGLSILAAPILGRLYAPDDYGVLASYMAFASVLSAISNWQYPLAIVVERSNARAHALVWVSIYASAITSAASALLGLALFLAPGTGHAMRDSALWFLLLPATVMTAGVVGAWSALANRLEQYRLLALTQTFSSVTTVALSMALGFAGWGATGLMIGYFVGQAYFVVVYGRLWLSSPRPPRPSLRRIIALARRHRHFAIWTTPSQFIGQFSMQIQIYLLTYANSLSLIGGFSRGRQLLLLPLSLIGNAIGQVFRQRASVDIARDGNCIALYRKASLGLLILGLPPTLLLMAIAPWLFATFLGPKWVVAGEVARILAPMLLLQLICSPVSSIMLIVGHQAEDFWLQIVFAALTLVIASIPLVLGWPMIDIVVGYAVAQSAMYATYIVRCAQLAGRRR